MKFSLISEPILTNSEFFLIHAFGFISLTRAYAISPFSSSLFTLELIIIFLCCLPCTFWWPVVCACLCRQQYKVKHHFCQKKNLKDGVEKKECVLW